jgi:hypothetical protein
MSISTHFCNRFLFWSVCAALTGVASSAHPADKSEKSDHLVPIKGIIEPAYQKLLRRKLYLTPANYVRIAILPSTGSIGETVFSFHSDKADTYKVLVTYTRAQSNLWAEASDANLALTIEPRAKIRRLDVPFPKSLAVSISEAIGRMIRESRQPSGTGPIIVDGTDFLFSIEAANGQQRQAILMAGSTGKNVATLIRLLEVLDRYCNAKESNRGLLLKEIETEVKRLH